MNCPHCGKPVKLAKPSDRGPTRTFDHDVALALLNIGATQTEVAKAFGVSRQRINQLARLRSIR